MNRFIEELSMNAWPALQTDLYDGWVIRYSEGYTKRANSVYPLYEGNLSIPDKLKYCEGFYDAKELPTTFKIHDHSDLHALDLYLEDQGYHVLDPTDVMVLDLAGIDEEDVMTYEVDHGYSDRAANDLAATIGVLKDDQRSNLVRQTMVAMMENINPASFYIFIKEDDEIIATGNGVVDQGYLGIFNMVVKETYRGKGYGKTVMKALIQEGKKLGANYSYLQVVCQNEVALNLYKGLGYEKVYRYWYRRKS